MNRRLAWLLLPAAALWADWASKAWILAHIPEQGQKVVIPGFFNLTLGWNANAIFGSLGWLPKPVRVALFLVAGVAAVGYFGWEFLRKETPAVNRIALGLILGGALGNGLDRWRHGAVVDFLDFVFWGWHYWTFNVADCCIVAGGLLLGLVLVRAAVLHHRQAKAAAGAPEA